MNHALRVVDNFLPEHEALALRAQALAADYAPFYGDGHAVTPAVKRAAHMPLPAVVRGIEDALERPIEAAHTGFRLDYDGELPHTLVHFDLDVGDYAAVLYLNPPGQCRGGTAFWRHRATCLNAVPPGANAAIQTAFRAEGMNTDNWTLESIIGMRWNRCVLYPTNHFHSRWPLSGFGAGPEDGRLVCGAFFNLKELKLCVEPQAQ